MGWFIYLITLGVLIFLALTYWWIWTIVVLVAFVGSAFLFSDDKNKKCAWCDGPKINFKNGREGSWIWEYRNKDGSRDKRVKDNFQQAGYRSDFACEECGATTQFRHYIDKKPSAHVKVWKRKLITSGSGERKGTDWEDPNSSTVYSNRENRKNN